MKLTGALLCLVIGFAAVKAFSISGRATFDASRPLTGSSLSFSGIPGLNIFSNLFGIRRPTTSTTKNRPSSTTHRPTTSGTSTTSPSSTSSSTNGPTSSESSTNGPSSSTTSGQGSSTSGSSTNVPTSSDFSTNVPTGTDLSTNVPTSSDLSTTLLSSSSTSGQGSSTGGSSTTQSGSSTTQSGSSTTQSGSSTYPAMPLRMPNIMNMFSVPSVDSFFSPNSVPSMPAMPGFSNLLDNSAIPGVDEAINEAREHVTEALSLGANFEISLDQAVQDALASNDPNAALRTLAQAVLDAYVTVAANCPLIVVGLRVLQEGIRLAGEIARSAGNIILGTTVSTTTVTSTT